MDFFSDGRGADRMVRGQEIPRLGQRRPGVFLRLSPPEKWGEGPKGLCPTKEGLPAGAAGERAFGAYPGGRPGALCGAVALRANGGGYPAHSSPKRSSTAWGGGRPGAAGFTRLPRPGRSRGLGEPVQQEAGPKDPCVSGNVLYSTKTERRLSGIWRKTEGSFGDGPSASNTAITTRGI